MAHLHGVGDGIEVTLVGDHDDSTTTLQFDTDDVSEILNNDSNLTGDFWLQGDAEQIEVTALNTGSEQVTAVRGVNGTTATTHLDGTKFRLFWVANQILELQAEVVTELAFFLFTMTGGKDGLFRNDAMDLFEVTENTVPDMEFDMAAGAGIINEQPVGVSSVTESDTLVAPSANPRIDVVEVNESGTMNVVTGNEAGSPSAPSVTSGSLGVAEIFHRVGTTEILDVDDSTNSFITDKRGDYQEWM